MGEGSTGAVHDLDSLSQRLAEFWENEIDDKKNWIRSYDMQNPSRPWVLDQLHDGESLLDVGCGPGTVYEDIQNSGKAIRYRGIDIAAGFVEACQELFPEGDFRVGDACRIDEPDDSFDTVLLRHVLEHTVNFELPIEEAYRVARKRVIIVLWRPLSDKPSVYRVPELGGSNDYNAVEFWSFIDKFVRPVEHKVFDRTQRPNWGWVIHKRLRETVFDLDDFCDNAPDWELLFDLKEQFPKLKVTLFTIPGVSSAEYLKDFSDLDWIELAVHGWGHDPNQECLMWSEDEAHGLMMMAEQMGVFVKGFRPPGWQISPLVLKVLKRRGYWVAVHEKDHMLVHEMEIPHFVAHGNPQSVHGHMQPIHQDNPYLRNGLRQLIEERGFPWDQDTEFRFVSDVLDAP